MDILTFNVYDYISGNHPTTFGTPGKYQWKTTGRCYIFYRKAEVN